MSASSSTSTSRSRAGGNPPAPKLKDSCDMCSSSKVKCNKDKPVCSRCRKLGYPCFYSPARRIGRPHPNRRTSTRESPEPRPRCRGRGSINDSMPPTPKDPHPPVLDTSGQIQRTPMMFSGVGNRMTGGGYGQNPLQWLDELYLPSGRVDNVEPTIPTHITGLPCLQNGVFPEKDLMSIPQTPLADFQYYNFSDPISNETPWLHSADLTTIPFEMPLAQSSQASSVDNAERLSCDLTPSSDSSEPDCVTGAIEILRQLQAFQSHAAGDISRENSPGSPDPAARVQIASSAITRLSTILVCPCSQKTYVAMLVAAVCMAILDIYESLFHQSLGSGRGAGPSPEIDSMMHMPVDVETTLETMGGGLEQATNPDVGMDDIDTQSFSMQVLEELSKLANVVMQFSRRYKGDTRTQSASPLVALADSLKLRLRLVTNEAFQRGSIY
ncbi:uncharacterized protein N7459_007982 [Penicillium hispanicum]|uniref:uncharacterized protein n=1 Tax=Penicillium hispanicum TaxID=1080232 RepID=UPI00254191C9|nr:uncharacterized protein N7459_007982 [Penicillium hispanicum]KAJ5573555.1 hypothetical protein N7459_007982 [Penicillium hispanicum]